MARFRIQATSAAAIGAAGRKRVPRSLLEPVPDAAALSEMRLEAAEMAALDIIDADERLRVGNTAVFPFSSIVSLIVLNPAGQPIAQGTGWLANATTVITAAHVVAPLDAAGQPRPVAAIAAIPGRNAAAAPFGSQTSRRVVFAPGWAAGPDRAAHDFGAVKLDQPVPAAGAVPPGAFPDASIPALVANLTGYPAIPPGDAPQGTQWGTTGAVRIGSPGMLAYGIDMTGGQSGAPLLVSVQGRIFAAGINVTGHSTFNQGVRVTDAVAGQIAQWLV